MIEEATDRVRRTAENRIATPPGGDEPPGHILYELRLIDDMAELHYIGGGRWALGVYEPSSYRRKVGGKNMQTADELEDGRKWRMAWLTYRGFSFISFHDVEPGRHCNLWKVVPAFRRRDWNWRNKRRQMERESKAAALNWRGRPSDEEFMERIEARISDAYPYLFGGRKHFPMS